MSDKTKIEWTDATWNPVTGCTRVSPGCENCYIDWAPPFRINDRHFRDASGERSHAIGSTTGVRIHEDRLDQPLRWKRPRRIFVNSLSDLFHDAVPDRYIAEVFAVMALAGQHTFQVLTKRHGRMRSLLSSRSFWTVVGHRVNERYDGGDGEHPGWGWTRDESTGDMLSGITELDNVWLGVTVEDQQRAELRIPALLDTPAAVRFLSCEPLLGPVDLSEWIPFGHCPEHDFPGGFCVQRNHPGVAHIDWVICGGESGPNARPMHPEWARNLRDQCTTAGVPFLFKQWGEWAPMSTYLYVRKVANGQMIQVGDPDGFMQRVGKKTAGRELDGRTWDEYPGGAR